MPRGHTKGLHTDRAADRRRDHRDSCSHRDPIRARRTGKWPPSRPTEELRRAGSVLLDRDNTARVTISPSWQHRCGTRVVHRDGPRISGPEVLTVRLAAAGRRVTVLRPHDEPGCRRREAPLHPIGADRRGSSGSLQHCDPEVRGHGTQAGHGGRNTCEHEAYSIHDKPLAVVASAELGTATEPRRPSRRTPGPVLNGGRGQRDKHRRRDDL